MYMQSHYERKIRSLESRIDFLEHELDFKQSIIDGNKKMLDKDFELMMMQRTKIESLLFALKDITGISQDEELLEKYEQKVKYVSDFVSWIDSEPPMWRLLTWWKWKNNRPERMINND